MSNVEKILALGLSKDDLLEALAAMGWEKPVSWCDYDQAVEAMRDSQKGTEASLQARRRVWEIGLAIHSEYGVAKRTLGERAGFSRSWFSVTLEPEFS